jgi:hypothetical protein
VQGILLMLASTNSSSPPTKPVIESAFTRIDKVNNNIQGLAASEANCCEIRSKWCRWRDEKTMHVEFKNERRRSSTSSAGRRPPHPALSHEIRTRGRHGPHAPTIGALIQQLKYNH